MNYFFLSLHTQVLDDARLIAHVFRTLSDYSEFTPKKYGVYEPLRGTFDPAAGDDFYGTLLNSPPIHWTSASRRVGGSICPRTGKGKESASISVYINADGYDSAYNLCEVLKRLARGISVHYGMVHGLCQPEIHKGILSHTVMDIPPNPPHLAVSRGTLVRCLPELYWVNIFGSEYIKIFGRDRVLSAPASKVEELPGNTFLVQVCQKIEDLFEKYEHINAIREDIKSHLCKDSFFDYEMTSKKTYRVPDLGWAEPIRWYPLFL